MENQWTGSPADKKDIINNAHIVFSASPDVEQVNKNIESLKNQSVNSRLLHCSDAHTIKLIEDKEFRIDEIIEDKKGRILVGTYNNGLFSIEKNSGKVTNILPDPNQTRTYSVRGIICDEQGNICLGTRGGIDGEIDDAEGCPEELPQAPDQGAEKSF